MKLRLLVIFMAVGVLTHAQEICNNAIDDDFDGLIDLNDPDCDCVVGDPENLIQNHSFEEYDTCPEEENQLSLATGWQSFNSATTEFYNTCGITTLGFGFPEPPSPFPGGGDGYGGIYMSGGGAYGWEEHMGQVLETPLSAGATYTFTFHASWCVDLTTVNLGLWGSPEEPGYDYLLPTCPDDEGSWVALHEETTTFSDAAWNEITWTFTPEEDIHAFAFGFGCEQGLWDVSYLYIDELSITQESLVTITESGDWCTDGDLILNASIDSTDGIWQWYKDGIALIGETADNIHVEPYGIGNYSAVYFVGEGCLRGDHLTGIHHDLEANFTAEDICFEQTMAFENTSVYSEEAEPNWLWDFGDEDNSVVENPTHLYWDPGVYSVQLIASAEGACNDTVMIDVLVKELPNADFEFIMNELSSADGATGGCVGETTFFNNLSFLEDGDVIAFDWNFGDGGDSFDENPEHIYSLPGEYTTTLEVLGDNGCVGEVEYAIDIKDGLIYSIDGDLPSCTGFEDGRVSVFIIGDDEAITYKITDADDVLRNIDNSHEALDLGAGWYYIELHEEYGYSAIDSVLVTDPEVLEVTAVTTDEMFGDDGLIDITVSGGTPPYTFDWNNDETGDFDDSEDLTAAGGTYTVVVRDNSGCEMELTVTLESQLGIGEKTNLELTIYPNPFSDFAEIKNPAGFKTTQYLVIRNVLGQEVYKQEELSGTTITIHKENLDAGVYLLALYSKEKQGELFTYKLIVK